MKRERYFNAIEFKDIKGIIYNSAKQYAQNIAFTIKHKNIMFSRIPVPADSSEVSIILDNIQDSVESVVIKRNRIFYR